MHTGIAALESPSIVGRCPRRAVLEPFGRANGQLGTWCRWHGHFLSQHFFNADAIAEGLESHDNRANQLRARQIPYQEIAHCLENRQSLGLETTYSGKVRPRLVEQANDSGFSVCGVFIGTTSHEINIERIQHRVATLTGHHVNDSEVRRRWTAAQENLVRTKH